jgi:carbon-monoxide dehydrogenase medium subunit
MRLAAPSTLVDINAVPGLDQVLVDEQGVHVGALARHADVLASPDVRRVQPLVTLALSHVAHATIRNRGTTVGSIVHADAAGEMPMVLVLLDGSVTVASTSGTRTIPASELYVGPLESMVRHDEVAVEAFFPGLGAGEGVGFEEIARRHGDYALVGVGAVVRVERDAVTSARLGYLSVSDVPVVVDVTEVLDGGISSDSAGAAGALALEHLDPADDLHATAAYRRQLVRVLTARVLRTAYDDAVSRGGGAA